MGSLTRTLAACDASAARDLAPWNVASEDRATAAWRAVKSLTPRDARQEQAAIAEMIEHLTALSQGTAQ